MRIGTELRLARIAAGLSIDRAAAAVGISNAEVSRIERALSPNVPFVTLTRIAAVVGLELSARLFPGASPLRDAGHVSLLQDFRSALHASLGWATEVPLPIPGDRRSWDATVRGPDWLFGVEAETAPRDGQALVRRIQLKIRDGGVDGVFLIVRDTRTVRAFVADAADYLATTFPIGSRQALASVRRGECPAGNAIVVVARAQGPRAADV